MGVERPDGENKMIPRRGVSRDNRRENEDAVQRDLSIAGIGVCRVLKAGQRHSREPIRDLLTYADC